MPEAAVSMADILFTCPKCSKPLAIDAKGVGLAIQCPECQYRAAAPLLIITLILNT